MLARGARLYGQLRLADRHPPVYNIVMSNVPGPQFPLYLAGSRLVDLYPMGPVFDGAGLNVTAMSYRDQVDIGFMACRETVPDLWRLAAEVPEALAELVKLARDEDA
jgi:diacylglycerol O-acyltransferase